MSVTSRMATEKQVNYLRLLCTRRDVEAKWVDMIRAEISGGIDIARASKWIEWFTKQPEREAPSKLGWSPVASIIGIGPLPGGTIQVAAPNTQPTPQTTTSGGTGLAVQPGIYVMPDHSLYRVQRAKSGVGFYASLICLDPNVNGGKPTYQYVKGAIFKVAQDGKPVSPAVASQIGINTGVCLICGRDLTDAKSVAAGIGPVCLKSQSALHKAIQGGAP